MQHLRPGDVDEARAAVGWEEETRAVHEQLQKEVRPRFRRGAAKVRPRCGRGAAEARPRRGRGAAEARPRRGLVVSRGLACRAVPPVCRVWGLEL